MSCTPSDRLLAGGDGEALGRQGYGQPFRATGLFVISFLS